MCEVFLDYYDDIEGITHNLILCGDVLNRLKYVKDNSVHLMITSPPYNIGIKYDNYDDIMEDNDYLEWLNIIWVECVKKIVDGGRICINIGENIKIPYYALIIQQLYELNLIYRGTIIWNKNNAACPTAWGSWNSCSNPHLIPRFEYIFIFSKNKNKLDGKKELCDLTKNQFMRYVNSIWNITPEISIKNHPTPFPIRLIKRLIKLYSYKQNIIMDPFCGSGTVGVAAYKYDRKFILIDKSLKYCKLAYHRIKNEYTGKPMF